MSATALLDRLGMLVSPIQMAQSLWRIIIRFAWIFKLALVSISLCQLKYNFLTVLSLTAASASGQGNPVTIQSCNNSNGRQWTNVLGQDNSVVIQAVDTGSCLIFLLQLYPLLIVLTTPKLDFCLQALNQFNAAPLSVGNCDGSANQQWAL